MRLIKPIHNDIFNITQFTEEVLGQAEKTDLDGHLGNLLAKAEATQQWTEKIMKQTEILLQPNPSKFTHVHYTQIIVIA